MEKEVQKKICKVCNVLKERIFDGMFDKKNKRWVNESGQLWNGLVCAECQVLKTKDNMKKLRNA